MCAFASVARASSVSTATALTVTTQDTGGRTKANLSVTVQGADGAAATGAVAILDGTKIIASAALDASGQATSQVSLVSGAHTLSAAYIGDTTHTTSVSATQSVQAQASTTAGFTLGLTAVSPTTTFPLTVTAGEAGTIKITVTPVSNTSLTAPMFVTLSCSNLPDQATCTFSPSSVEILSTTPTSCASGAAASACPPTSQMVLQTQASGTAKNVVPTRNSNPVAWAFLLPGMIGLGGLAWGARRRRWISRCSLLALVAVVVTLGTTGCNPQYGYYHHSPDTNLPTPAGTYTIKVTGQSSDGITAITDSTTFALTVQ